MKPVYWTPEARARLKDVQEYILNQDAPKAAKKVISVLLSRARQLQEVPLSGRKVPDYPDDDLHELLERPYRIIYRITDKQIEIITVMHYRQLLPSTVSALRDLHKKR